CPKQREHGERVAQNELGAHEDADREQQHGRARHESERPVMTEQQRQYRKRASHRCSSRKISSSDIPAAMSTPAGPVPFRTSALATLASLSRSSGSSTTRLPPLRIQTRLATRSTSPTRC